MTQNEAPITLEKPVTLEALQAKLQAVFSSWLKAAVADREADSSLYNYSINISFDTLEAVPSHSSVIVGSKIELAFCVLGSAEGDFTVRNVTQPDYSEMINKAVKAMAALDSPGNEIQVVVGPFN